MADESPHLDEGCSAAPGISPGVVSDDEFLLRELYSPDQSEENTEKLSITAIPAKHLIESGFSISRQTFVQVETLNSLIAERLERPRKTEPWESLGVARLNTKEVRDLRLRAKPDEQAFVVTDTATEDRPFHASIYAAKQNAKESHARQLRKILLPVLEARWMSVDDAYAIAQSKDSP